MAPSPAFEFRLNGRTVAVSQTSPQRTLLDHIRDLGLTGAKEGCAEGECGACTVVLVKQGAAGVEYRPVNSCLMLLPMAAGQEIYTVESLTAHLPPGVLHPAQQGMVEYGGSQCGYCTPGFVMSLFAEYYRPGREGSCDLEALGGNLCRCTGYRPICDAALSLGVPLPEDPFRRRLAQPAPAVAACTYADRETRFSRPASLAECLAEIQANPHARPIAGGTDLVVESNLRGARFSHLISLEAIPELQIWRETADRIEIGAGLTLNEIAARWPGAPAVFREWLYLFASPLIRNRATLGGNLVTASPIGDAAPLLLSLDAEVRIASPAGERIVPLQAFFAGYRKTTLRPGELLVSIRIPKPLPQFARFYKVAKRRLDDISTVSACFALSLDRTGCIENARISYGGVAQIPTRALEAERAIEGRRWLAGVARLAQDAIARSLRPISDPRGSAAYRLAMAQSLLEKFVYQTREEAA
jgi:xanthine dehydrogenase small subunit